MIKKLTYIKTVGLFISLCISNLAYSQIETHHVGKNFMVESHGKVVVIGNLIDTVVSTTTNTISLKNQGLIQLNGDLKNYGTTNFFGANPDLGRLEVYGTTGHSILGTNQTNLCNLDVNLSGLNLSIFKRTQINDSLNMVSGNVFLTGDTLVMYYLPSATTSTFSGIINETDSTRIFGPNFPVVVQNYSWMAASTYSFVQLKGIGINFKSNDVLGATKPNIYRFNLAQQCGPTQGSVDRTYRFDNIQTPGNLQNVTGRFHDPLERSMFVDGDSMHIYVSTDNLEHWRDVEGTSTTGVVTNSPYVKTASNLTAYTITKDSCDSIPDVYIHQILNVSDTIFYVDTALFCDSLNPSARLVAGGSIGDFVWVTPTGVVEITNNPELLVDELGSYSLICTDARGCMNRKDIELVAATPANSDIAGGILTGCDQMAMSFSPTNAVSGSTYYWDFGDSSVVDTTTFPSAGSSYTYATSGNYTVTLTASTSIGCVSVSTESIIIHPIPVPEFSAGTACVNMPVSFDNQTTIAGSNAVNLNWDFTSNGSVDTTTSLNTSGGDATAVYTTAGIYTVELYAESMLCYSDTVSHTVTVFAEPTPNFTVASACQGTPVSFTNITDTIGFSPTTFLWNFDTSLSGFTSIVENPTFLYPGLGPYNVSLQATSDQGCIGTMDTTVTVDENPVSAFSLTDTCENSQALFTDQSTSGGTSISTWSWDFGDGNSSMDPLSTSNIYSANGIYTATLTVSTPQNCTSTSTESITIFNGPSVGFSVLPTCENVPVNVWNTTTNAVSYKWNISDLAILDTVNTNQILTFGNSGYHDILLIATSVNGCTDTIVDSVLVNSLPIDNFGDTTTACGNTLNLDANNNSSNPTASFLWNTGSNTSGITVTVAGLYTVNITTVAGCSIIDTTYAMLNVPISPNLGNDGAQCDSAELNAGYYGSGVSYDWGSSVPAIFSTTQEISVFAGGQYIVHVTDQNLCVGSDTINITIVPSTPVDLGSPLQDTCEGLVYTLASDITGSYLWNDGSTNATLDVATPGYYWVEVTAGGCSSRDTVEVAFNAIPSFSLGGDSQDCDSLVLNAYAGTGVTYGWSTQNGNTQFSDTVYNTGTYWADVTLTSTGCVIRDSIDVTIHSSPVINLPGDTSICSYQTLTIDPGNPGGVNFLWNTGATTPTIDVASTGNYSVTLVDATTGCLSANSMNVISLPLFTFDLGNDVPYCEGSTVIIEADVTVINATYNWYNNTSTLASTETYTVLDTGLYYLEIIDEHGCSAIDSIDVLPSNLVLYSVFLVDSDIESCDTVQFVNLSYPKPYTSSWNFGDGSATVSDSMPLKRYCLPLGIDSMTYEVTLTVNNGTCNSVETKSITVKVAGKTLENEPYNPELYNSILEAIVFPNPNNGDFTLRLKLENTAAIQVDVFNLMGQLIETDSFTAKEIDKPYTLNKILPGMYLVRIRAGRDEKTVKFIKIYR